MNFKFEGCYPCLDKQNRFISHYPNCVVITFQDKQIMIPGNYPAYICSNERFIIIDTEVYCSDFSLFKKIDSNYKSISLYEETMFYVDNKKLYSRNLFTDAIEFIYEKTTYAKVLNQELIVIGKGKIFNYKTRQQVLSLYSTQVKSSEKYLAACFRSYIDVYNISDLSFHSRRYFQEEFDHLIVVKLFEDYLLFTLPSENSLNIVNLETSFMEKRLITDILIADIDIQSREKVYIYSPVDNTIQIQSF